MTEEKRGNGDWENKGILDFGSKGEGHRAKGAALEGMHFVHGRELRWKREILRRVAPQTLS